MSAALLETDVHRVALGVRLRDAATCAVVADDVEVSLVTRPRGRRLTPVRSPSGAFGFHAADATAGGHLEVLDRSGSFFSFTVEIPPPSGRLVDVSLYSRPSRPLPAGFAVVRAQLCHEATGEPAAFAALEVSPGAQVAVRGIADERGAVLVVFRLPEPPAVPGQRTALAATTFPLGINVGRPRTPPAADALPTLDDLTDQIPATLVTAPPKTELATATLTYGQELVLRSGDGDARLLVRQ